MQIFAFVSPPTTISLQPLATVLILMPILAFVSPRTSTSLQPLGTVSFLLGLRQSRLPKITFVVSKTTCMALVASVLRAFVVNAPLSLQQILVLLHVSGNTATKLVLIRRHYQNMSRVIKIVCLEEFTHWNAIAKITIAVNRKNMVPFWLLADPLKFHLFLTGPCFPSLPPLRCGALKETRFPTSFPLSLLCLSPALPPRSRAPSATFCAFGALGRSWRSASGDSLEQISQKQTVHQTEVLKTFLLVPQVFCFFE